MNIPIELLLKIGLCAVVSLLLLSLVNAMTKKELPPKREPVKEPAFDSLLTQKEKQFYKCIIERMPASNAILCSNKAKEKGIDSKAVAYKELCQCAASYAPVEDTKSCSHRVPDNLGRL